MLLLELRTMALIDADSGFMNNGSVQFLSLSAQSLKASASSHRQPVLAFTWITDTLYQFNGGIPSPFDYS